MGLWCEPSRQAQSPLNLISNGSRFSHSPQDLKSQNFEDSSEFFSRRDFAEISERGGGKDRVRADHELLISRYGVVKKLFCGVFRLEKSKTVLKIKMTLWNRTGFSHDSSLQFLSAAINRKKNFDNLQIQRKKLCTEPEFQLNWTVKQFLYGGRCNYCYRPLSYFLLNLSFPCAQNSVYLVMFTFLFIKTMK